MRLDLTGLEKWFGSQAAVRGITQSISDFQALAIIGPSGGGKTTLLRLIAGLEIPDLGTIAINGEQLVFSRDALMRHRQRIGMVFQAYNLFPHLSALDNITLPLEKVHGYSPAAAREHAMSLLERFQLLLHAAKKPAELSGGQQQRVAIVRAIAIRPRFLLFDEPTSALDPEMTAEVLEVIEELRHEGRDLIMATHHIGFARQVADYCLFVSDGTVTEAGLASELFSHPQTAALDNFLAKVLKY